MHGTPVLEGVQDVEHAHEGRLRVDEVAGGYDRGWCGRRTTTGTVTAAFDQDGRQHAKTITEGVQVARPVDPGMFETRNFTDAESPLRDPHMDQCLDLEAVAPQQPVGLGRRRRGDVEVQYRNVPLPEHIESVAEV